MLKHRTYVEKSGDFERMAALVTGLNARGLCDWSLGRLYAWRWGRWSRESQDDAQFERQAELFYGDAGNLAGMAITENFGDEYYFLSDGAEETLRGMADFLASGGGLRAQCAVIVRDGDGAQKAVLAENGFVCRGDADTTYSYRKEDFAFPQRQPPEGFTLTDQETFRDAAAVERQRFYAFNPGAAYDAVIDQAYRYARGNPLLVPALQIVLLDAHSRPASSCMGYWDEQNRLMEVEVVATLPGYENRGFAKMVVSECMRRGFARGVVSISISGWEEKTRRLYASFGRPHAEKKVRYASR